MVNKFNPVVPKENFWYQQAYATPHNSADTRKYLKLSFINVLVNVKVTNGL